MPTLHSGFSGKQTVFLAMCKLAVTPLELVGEVVKVDQDKQTEAGLSSTRLFFRLVLSVWYHSTIRVGLASFQMWHVLYYCL